MVSFQKYSILEDLSDKKQYSGLISGMEWRVLDEPIRMYGFHYDSQKRLSRANYAHQMPMYGAESEDVGGFNTIYEYDDNGNITLLKRKGITNYIPDPGYYVYGEIDWLGMDYEGNRLKTVVEPTSLSQSHGYKSLGEEFTYDAAGNVTYDGGKGADFKNYNALDLPTEVERITSTGTVTGKVVNTYDASGTKWSTDHTYYNQGSHNQNIKYVNGLELLDNGQFVLHHEEGRYVSNSGESNYEYVISDHLGNGRVWFQDLDGDGDLSLDPANLEVKQVKHYYPFGMTMGIQSLQTYAPPADRNQYNGIEFFEGLDYNMAFYRTLDPGIGRWLQVDPEAEGAYSHSPYNSMFNNPVGYSDPLGDFPVPLLLAIAKATTMAVSISSASLAATLPIVTVAASSIATTSIIGPSSIGALGITAIGASSSLNSLSASSMSYVRSGYEGYGFHETLYDIKSSRVTDLTSVPSQDGLPTRYHNTYGYWIDNNTAFIKKFTRITNFNSAKMLSTYGGPNGLAINAGTAIVGPEAVVGNLAVKSGLFLFRGIRNVKLLNQYNSIESVIENSRWAKKKFIHGKQYQKVIKGNADDIFNQVRRSYNAKLKYDPRSGHKLFKTGNSSFRLTSSSDNIPTFRINHGGEIFNIRVN